MGRRKSRRRNNDRTRLTRGNPASATPPDPAPADRRSRRRLLWAIPALLVLVAGFLGLAKLFSIGPGSRGPKSPLNVVIVTGDTIRADRLPAYGYERLETPHLDRMVREGVLFEHAQTVVPLTLPAHSSLFTGTYPLHHGVRDNGGYYLEDDQVTLAESLQERGYATGAFVGAFVLDSRWGIHQGFDRYFDDFDFSKYEKVSLDSVQRRGGEVLAEALSWMETARTGPFFSWIHLYDAHTPYEPPEPYRSRYAGYLFGQYDGEIAYVDSLVGELLDWLEGRGLLEQTIVIFIGDHGESLGDHEEMTHGFFIYDATMHVPFIMRLPAGSDEKGRRIAAQVRSIDVMPTLLDLLGGEVPAAVQGQSLLPLLRGEVDDLNLIAYGESYYPRHHYGWSELKSLRNGALHFIDAPRPELFDVRMDPGQRDNLASERPGTVEQFQSLLQEVTARNSLEGIDERTPESMDPETQAQLAALGYIGGPSKVKIDPDRPLADPKDKIALFNLIKQAGSDSSEDRVDDALEKIERVLAEDPDILEAHNIQGNLYVKKGAFDRAIAAYREALTRDPEYTPALFGMATAYLDSGRTDEAAAGYRRILDLDPRDNRAAFQLAKIYAERKDYETALDLLHEVVDLGSERAPMHNLMAECYIALERWDEAQTELDRVLELKADLPMAHFNLGLIREGRGDLRGAIDAYEKEIEITPKAFRAHFNVAKLYGKLGPLDKMAEHFRRSIEINDEFAEGHLYLAKYHLDTGDLEQAMTFARKGIELGPEPSIAPLGHYILADVFNRLGRPRDAERELAEAQRLQRGS